MSPYVWYLLLRNLPYTLNPLRPARSRYRGIKWWKKRYRHREGLNQETYALKAYHLSSRIKPGTAIFCVRNYL
ncbi:hypothetical protein H8356DRAFT_1359027 [Neocallimastix lanati (nom. inval.)]|nr:hypothetical protein H8356DRAFT_1359027 [Neocallimastix sp. JGI-2020a]